jgi:mannose-6-phosphate isomerase-like protein (cupin superfamily)
MALRTCESPGIAAGIKSLPCSESLLRKKNRMNATSKFVYRDPSEVEPWEETCGQIRPLIEEKDGAAAEIHHVEIDDAKLHYHERTDEFYYVIEGRGTMILDNETVELHQGVVVYVPRGTRHKAIGKLTILTICIPPGVLDDIHEME